MTIHLPENLESSIREAVHSGQFASMDEAMAEAARLLLDRLKQPSAAGATPMSEAAFKRHLLATGLMSSLPTPADPATRPAFQPIAVEGEPVSETIIRERR
jgi:Arc/MetJ-type ribon-helix-helix transcriptional regulator